MAEHDNSSQGVMSPEQRILDTQKLNAIKAKFLERLQEVNTEDLVEVPNFLSLMYVWCLAGGEEDAKAWSATKAAQDEGFVDLLERLGLVHPIQMTGDPRDAASAKMLEILFGSVERVEQRLKAIISNQSLAKHMRAKADRVMSNTVDGQQNDGPSTG